MDEKQRHTTGMKTRRTVLGDAHVNSAEAKKDWFTEPFQDLITRYAWGEVWSRPGLPPRTRSLVVLATLVALNRNDEFRMHIRAALGNKVTREEIQEVLLQCAIYCGVPAANTAFHIAQQVFAEIDSQS
ncbi:MAG: 4-carboxymuconolactone decarboxylase [Candidatus Acidiferrales bacterium]